MSFISYAQNYEDVILHRALKDIESGFYIDIGAQDPVEYSVTKALYDHGWRGINVEPVAHWFEKLVVDRPHDINLQLAAAERQGNLHLYEILNTGLSTTSAEFAHRHIEKGFSVHEVDVACMTLDEICESNAVETVHFLKIDCEGSGSKRVFVRPLPTLDRIGGSHRATQRRANAHGMGIADRQAWLPRCL
jgi:FkbM family methyltransferase